MTQQTVLEIAAPACVAQEFEGEVIALNLEKGTYYSLRGLSAVLWRDLAAGHAIEALAALTAARSADAEAVRDFAANLMAQGLLRPASGAVATTAPAFDNALADTLAAGGAMDLVFEVFDDMNSLILLDPVHDIDTSRGWPNPPTNA